MNKVELGRRIQAVRGNLSREAFAWRIGITAGSLRNYEQGLAWPNAEVITKICAVSHVQAGWLLTGDGPMYHAAGDADPAEVLRGLHPDPAGPAIRESKALGETVALSETAAATEEACPRCGELGAELAKAREECRRLGKELCDTVSALRDQVAVNTRLWENLDEVKNRAHALEMENVRLQAARGGASAQRKKGSRHVGRIPMISPSRVQEEPETFPAAGDGPTAG